MAVKTVVALHLTVKVVADGDSVAAIVVEESVVEAVAVEKLVLVVVVML